MLWILKEKKKVTLEVSVLHAELIEVDARDYLVNTRRTYSSIQKKCWRIPVEVQ